jgi:NAD(P)-dependent dehydrogenase (short-subunit alcohol dehydrogenase family)
VDLILENLPHLLRLRELARPRAAAAAVRFDLAAVQSRCTERIAGARFNESLRGYGIEIDGAFHSVREIWRRPGEALAKVGFPVETGAAKFAVHPAFLDGCGRVLAAAIDREPSGLEGFYLPSGVGELKLHGRLSGAEVWSHAVLRKTDSADALIGDVRVYDEAGSPLIDIEALRLQRVDRNERAEDFGGLLYRRVWKRLPARESVVAAEPGDWLIWTDRAAVGERLVRRLEAAGQTCALMFAGAGDGLRLLGARSWKGVVHLRGLDLAAGDVDAGTQVTADVMEIVQALAAGAALPRPKLWLVTAGAIPVLEDDSPAVAQSLLWGLGQAVAAEHPAMWGGLIDLDPRGPSELAIADAILDTRREDMVALRSGKSYVARIVRDDRIFGSAAPLRFKPDATYVIAGGTGGLGRRLAVWLEERGAGNIVLLGRGASGPRAMRCDVSERAQVAEAFQQIERSMPPVRGIFHLAGILDDAMLVHQDAERFHRAGAAKIEGAWNLHECSARLALDHFVMFSSMASLVTMPGQGSYASANGFLDALAHLRRSEGKPSLSVNWGTWAEIGHAATDYGRRAHERLANMGIDPLAPDLALAVLGFLMERGVTQSGVARVNWVRLFEADPAAASPLLSEFLQPGAPAAAETELLREVRRRRPDERREFVISALAGMLADALRLPDSAAIAPDRSLFDLGLDSILALELTNRISTGFGHPFRATLFFTHPTLATVADYVLREAAPPEESSELGEEELSELIAKEIGRA